MICIAHLNEARICVAISSQPAAPAHGLFVRIDRLDRTLLGRHHDGERWGREAPLAPAADTPPQAPGPQAGEGA